MKEKFKNYIFNNYSIDDGRKIISNVIDWLWYQSMDKEDSINCLLCMLNGIGIEKEEIEQFINWD